MADFQTPPMSTPLWFGIADVVNNFVGRHKELQLLENLYNERKLTIVTGMGGIGKSELVKSFANSKRLETNCVWFDGEITESLRNSLERLADALGIEKTLGELSRDHDKIFQDIINKLRKITTFPIILIIDNVDKSNYLLHDLLNIKVPFMFTILTSRNLTAIGEAGYLIDLNVLTNDDACLLVRESLKDEMSDVGIVHLVNSLQNLPLALQQAVSFIKKQKRVSRKGIMYSIQDYMDSYNNAGERLDLLNFRLSTIEHTYRLTTFITWDASIRKMLSDEKLGEVSIQLLYIMAYLDPDFIQLGFLKQICSAVHSHFNTEKAVDLIKEYCLVKVEDDAVSMHKLTQEVIRLKKSDEDEVGLLRKLLTALSMTNLGVWPINQVQTVWGHSMNHAELVREFEAFPDAIAHELISQFRYGEYYEFTTSNYEKLKSILGEEHIQTLHLESAIPNALTSLADKGLQIYVTLCEDMKRIQDKNPSAITTVSLVAGTLSSEGKHEMALQIYRDIFEMEKRVLGYEHPVTRTTTQRMVQMFQNLGTHEKALELYQKFLGRSGY